MPVDLHQILVLVCGQEKHSDAIELLYHTRGCEQRTKSRLSEALRRASRDLGLVPEKNKTRGEKGRR